MKSCYVAGFPAHAEKSHHSRSSSRKSVLAPNITYLPAGITMSVGLGSGPCIVIQGLRGFFKHLPLQGSLD